jgi:Spy/CpxP family protein refolding chaperone
MKTSKWLAITFAALLGLGGFVVLKAHAAAGAGSSRAFRGRMLERLREKLALTDDQVSQIKAVLQSEKENLKGQLTRLHEARTALRETIQAPDANEASVRVASSKVAAVEADLAVERMKLRARINPILTDEQRAKISRLQSQVDQQVNEALDRMGETPAE